MRGFIVWFVSFVGLEILLLAVSALIDPQWTAENAILLFAVGAVLLLFSLAIQNRRWVADWINEDRTGNGQANDWISSEDAGRYFRDRLGEHDELYDIMRIFDEEYRKADGGADGVVWAFRFWWPEGFENQLLEARGVPVAGKSYVQVNEPIIGEENQFEWLRQTGEGRPDQIALADGQDLRQLEFTRPGVDALVAWLLSQRKVSA